MQANGFIQPTPRNVHSHSKVLIWSIHLIGTGSSDAIEKFYKNPHKNMWPFSYLRGIHSKKLDIWVES